MYNNNNEILNCIRFNKIGKFLQKQKKNTNPSTNIHTYVCTYALKICKR